MGLDEMTETETDSNKDETEMFCDGCSHYPPSTKINYCNKFVTFEEAQRLCKDDNRDKYWNAKPIKCESCGALIYDKDTDRLPLCSACNGYSRRDGNLSTRKVPTANRYGQAQRFLDAVQALIELKGDAYVSSDLEHDGEDCYLHTEYDTKVVEKILSIVNELRVWDVTKNGNLYLTSGGRVVLDKGYGEYFNEGDHVLLTLEQLHSGMRFSQFQEIMTEAREAWRKNWPEDSE